jgi:hypothetical protein
MTEGYVKIHRSIWKSKHFDREPFTQREAFIWMISHAAWRDEKTRRRGRPITLKRGQLIATIREMAESWQWSRGKVERFFIQLKTENLIETTSESLVTVITICNYEKYQVSAAQPETNSETTSETKPRQNRDKTACNQLILNGENGPKKLKKVKNKTLSDTTYPHPSVDGQRVSEAVRVYNETASKLGLPRCQKLTPDRRNKLRLRLNEVGGLETWVQAIEHLADVPGLIGTNDRGWRVSIDFLLRPGAILRITEGAYDHWKGISGKGNGRQPYVSAEAKLATEFFYEMAEELASFGSETTSGGNNREPDRKVVGIRDRARE